MTQLLNFENSSKLIIRATTAALYVAVGMFVFVVIFLQLNAFNFDPDEYRVLTDITKLSLLDYLDSKFGYFKTLLAYVWLSAHVFGPTPLGLKIGTTLIAVVCAWSFYSLTVLICGKAQLARLVGLCALTALFLVDYNYYYFRWGMINYSLSILCAIIVLRHHAINWLSLPDERFVRLLSISIQLVACYIHIGLLTLFAAIQFASFIESYFWGVKERFWRIVYERVKQSWFLLGLVLFLFSSGDTLSHLTPRPSTAEFSFPHSSFPTDAAGLWGWTQFAIGSLWEDMTHSFATNVGVETTKQILLGVLALAALFFANRDKGLRVLAIVLASSLGILWLLSAFGFYRFGTLRYELYIQILFYLLIARVLAVTQIRDGFPRLLSWSLLCLLGLVLSYQAVLTMKGLVEQRSRIATEQNIVLQKVRAASDFTLVDRHFNLIVSVENPGLKGDTINIGYQQRGTLRNSALLAEDLEKILKQEKVNVLTRYRFSESLYPEWYRALEEHPVLYLTFVATSPGGNFYEYTKYPAPQEDSDLTNKWFIYDPVVENNQIHIKAYFALIAKTRKVSFISSGGLRPLEPYLRPDLHKKYEQYPLQNIFGVDFSYDDSQEAQGIRIEFLDGSVETISLNSD